MRARDGGFSLVEVMISSIVLSLLLMVAMKLMAMSNDISQNEGVKQYTQLQAKKVLDAVADDFRCSAAWCYTQVNPSSGASAGRLTKFTAGTTYKTSSVANAASFAFGTGGFDASANGVAFLRVRGQQVINNSGAGIAAYLIIDFEPLEPASTVWSDVGADGGAPANNQPGRMNDDPNIYAIFYRAVASKNRVQIERVRGLAAIDVGGGPTVNTATTSELPTPIGDLGPTTLPTGVTQGFLKIEGIDTASKTGSGKIKIHVQAVGLMHNGEVVLSDLTTMVDPMAATPPY